MAKIALALIQLPVWNSRVTNAETDKSEQAEVLTLAESMKVQGQLQPVEVEGPFEGGGYTLVYGTRRRAAALKLGWTEIDATVRPPTDDATRMARNVVENVKRKNLTSYEEARAVQALSDKGLTNGEIANVVGFSSQKVSNLHSRITRLPAPIVEEWKKRNPAATDEFLAEINSDKNFPTAEKKMQRWDERIAEIAAAKEAGQTPGKRGKGKNKDGEGSGSSGYPVSQKRLGHVIDSLASKKLTPELSDDTRNWARALVAFIIQGRETPPTGVPPLPVKMKAEKGDKSGK